jgi:hypothetical protein
MSTEEHPWRWKAALLGILLFALVVGRWLTTPFDDAVPLIPHEHLATGVDVGTLPTAARFRCSAPLGDGDPAHPPSDLDGVLELQDLDREPCGARGERMGLGLADLVLVAAALVLVVVKRPTAHDEEADREAPPVV